MKFCDTWSSSWKLDIDILPFAGGSYNLFAFPSECNFSGLRFNLDLVKIIKEDPKTIMESSPFCKYDSHATVFQNIHDFVATCLLNPSSLLLINLEMAVLGSMYLSVLYGLYSFIWVVKRNYILITLHLFEYAFDILLFLLIQKVATGWSWLMLQKDVPQNHQIYHYIQQILLLYLSIRYVL